MRTATRNYEIDRSVSHRKSVPGTINRLSVAVVVDLQPRNPFNEGSEGAEPPTPLTKAQIDEKMERFTRLVKDTIGYNEARGDSVNVSSETFTPVAALLESSPLPIWQEAWVFSAAKQLGASIIVLLLIFAVLRPALKGVVKQPVSTLTLAQASPQLASAINHVVQLSSDETQQKLPAKSAFDENLQLAQSLVKNEPARAARMIREWVNND